MSTPADHPLRVTRTVALAQWMLHAFTEELQVCGGGPVGVTLLAPGGGAPPADWVCLDEEHDPAGQTREGMAWARIGRRFPTDRFPGQATTAQACSGSAVELELGVYRCAATIDDEGVPPDPEDVTADAVKVDADAHAVLAAIKRLRWPYVLGGWTVLGPSGGVVGGAQLFTVLLSQGPIGKER